MKDCCERDAATSRVSVGTGTQRDLVTKFRGKFIREAQTPAGVCPCPKPAPPADGPKTKSLLWVLLAGIVVIGVFLCAIFGGQKKGSANAQTVNTATSGSANGHDWVDLGLSVKWATCNLGAASPSDYGHYYAWGETGTKNDYTWTTLKYCADNTGDSFTRYNTKSEYGPVDNKTRLERADDAARANWGEDWRMPTKAEFDELKSKCTWTWTSQGGKNGYKVTGKNGNSIFLPAAGYRGGTSAGDVGSGGGYWSSSLYTGEPFDAWDLSFDSSDVLTYYYNRCYGESVRPVTE